MKEEEKGGRKKRCAYFPRLRKDGKGGKEATAKARLKARLLFC